MKMPAFGWMLVLGAFASVGAIAVQSAPTLREATNGSVPTTSAEQAFFSLPGAAIEASVTDLQPDPGDETNSASAAEPGGATTPAVAELEAAGARSDDADAPALPLTAAATPGSLPSGLTPATTIDAVTEKEAEFLDQMNGARLELGLQPLLRYAELDEVALARARHLVGNGYFDHYAPDGTSAFSELALRGLLYRLAGENLARNNYPSNQTVVAAFQGLMASPGHRANILEPMFGAVGVAVVRDGNVWVYVTVFTNPR